MVFCKGFIFYPKKIIYSFQVKIFSINTININRITLISLPEENVKYFSVENFPFTYCHFFLFFSQG